MIAWLALPVVVLLVLHLQAGRRLLAPRAASGAQAPRNEADAARLAFAGTEVLALALAVALITGMSHVASWGRVITGALVAGALLLAWVPGSVPVRGTPAFVRWLGRLPTRASRSAAEPSRRADPLDEQALVERVLAFSEKEISEVMIPRSDMIAVEKGSGIASLVSLIEEHRHSRYPVFEGSVDHVVGCVDVLDLLQLSLGENSFESLVKPIVLVPQSKGARDLLDELLARSEACALVVDEFGGTAGFVTVEDLIEEIIGDILDEHEEEWRAIRRTGRDVYVCDATIPIAELREAIGLVLPEGDYETLAGFLLEEFGRIPTKGDSVTRENASFEIVRASRQRIELVQVRLRRPTSRR